ncbi:glycosyl transferase family protein [Halodesulfovibrio marinisediminis]|uniref:Adsorption protein B n=1 Tax=Halodesulfovibrio marinisediminis DSM 17456 TaxID=1121457 RepID=A0A1N6DV80_9BACT|nr:glycosyl transferase family protein [Halodesulfovibrio marinisediminis]SIN74661.1 adsorption protein B [Halodesulfovibrio marinisediminis DSM 17456]
MLNEVGIILFLVLKIVFIFVAIVFVISGIDEFFIDLCYFFRETYRRLFITNHYKRLSEEQLLAKPEQSVAIMVPCWDEGLVIRRMLENAIRTVNYSNYVIFVGTYPNDPATQREVDKVRDRYSNVERIMTPHDGPTSKADCLNWLYEGILIYEKENNKKFDIFVLQDSEDILHPLQLKLCNYIIPKLDMVQLPVHPMPRDWSDFTGNHYLDEFAENHTRDLIVREALTGSIPSAGVGTALSRRTLELTAKKQRNLLFDTASLAEDYAFGLGIKELGLKQAFVRQWIWRNKMVKSFFTRRPKQKRVQEFISIREYFPNTFKQAVGQKTRWVMGITLQGWESMGWRGGLASKYMLWRDRKTIVTNLVNFIGNFLFVLILGLLIYNTLTKSYKLPPLVDDSRESTILISICLFFLVWRIIMRVTFVVRTYNWFQGLLSVPRLFWGNIINFVATIKAISKYTKVRITGETLEWEKTRHVYPSEDELRAYRRRLGDLLLDRRFLTVEQLDKALKEKRKTKKKLGEVLIDLGYITEDQLVQTLGIQFRVETQEVDPYSTPAELLELVPTKLAVKYNVYPLVMRDGQLLVATNEMLDEASLRELEQKIGHVVRLRLASRSDISFAIRRGYERKLTQKDSGFLGKMLVDKGEITSEQLTEALRAQRRQYLPLGEILISQEVLTKEKFEEANAAFLEQDKFKRIGEFLLDKGYIDAKQLNSALTEQEKHSPLLGEVLIEQGVISPENLDHFLSTWEIN